MFTRYDDILDRAGEPVWWDERGVPRYCAFSPMRCNDIYTDEAVLIAIECQNCGRPSLKAYTQGGWARVNRNIGRWLRDDIRDRSFDGGDPPNYCCGAGASEGATLKHVVEYWARHDPIFVENGLVTSGKYSEWKRDPAYEISLEGNVMPVGRP